MKKFIVAAIIAAMFSESLSAHEFRRAQTFLDVWAGSCTVQTPNALGTGQFNGIDRDENKAVITTNYHVVTTNKNVTLHFLTNGKMESVSGTVRRKAYDENAPVDVAQIYVDVDELARIDPPYLPYAGRGASPAVGGVIASSGCPRGTFPKAWRGTILNYYNAKTAVFTPAPEPGQSGSAIVSIYEDGLPYQTGILTWLFTNSKTGGAIPIKNVYEAFEGRSATSQTNGSAFPTDATLCGYQEEDPTQELIGIPNFEDADPPKNYKWFAPLVDDRADISFLDDNDAAWRNRNKGRSNEGGTNEQIEKPQIIQGIGSGALIDRTANALIEKTKNEIVKEAKRAAAPVFSIAIALLIFAGVCANLCSCVIFKCLELFKADEEEPKTNAAPQKTRRGTR